MPHPLSSKLLALATSVAADGGEGVRRTLRDLVAEAAPFDAAEIVHRGDGGLTRWGLGPRGEGEGLAADDLLAGLWSLAAPLRFDDQADMASFPATRDLLRGKGLRSLLALPLPTAGGGGDAALLIARSQGWGFAAASLAALQPMAAVAGAALARALAMTSLRLRVDELEAGLSAGGSDRSTLRRELVLSRGEREALRHELGELRERLAAEEARGRGAEAHLQQIVAARDALQAEAAGRDGLAAALREQERKVAELEVRVEELTGTRGALQADLERARGDLQQRDSERQLLREQMRSTGGELNEAALAERDRRREEEARREAEIDALRRALESTRDEAARARAEGDQVRSALGAVEGSAGALERSLRQVEDDRDALRAELGRRDAAALPPPAPLSSRRPRAARKPAPASPDRGVPRGPKRRAQKGGRRPSRARASGRAGRR